MKLIYECDPKKIKPAKRHSAPSFIVTECAAIPTMKNTRETAQRG